MDLLIAIAILCQVPGAASKVEDRRGTRSTIEYQLECQQLYLHCVKTKTFMDNKEALEKCVMEKKL